MILGIETSCDETAAALVTEDGEIRANVVASQAELHARYGGVVPEIASRRHLELVSPVVREALGEADATLDDVETRRGHAGPGPDRGAARRPLRGEGARLGAAAAARRRSTICTGTSPRSTSAPDPVEPPFLCLLASGGHTLLLDVRERGGYRVLGTTDRRRRRRGVRQGRPAARPRLPRRRASSTGLPERATRRRSRFRSRGCDGLDFSFSGVKTALLYAVARPRRRRWRRAGPTSRRSYQRAIVRALVERTRRPRRSASSSRRSRSSAGRGQLRAARRAARTPASRRSRSAPTTPR